MSLCRCPSRDPVLLYGRGVCDAVGRVVVEERKLFLLGVVAVERPGGLPPRTLCDKFLAGVGARLGGFRRGDSGLGSEGRFGLRLGLGGRAPGPIVCENLCGSAGVGGVYALLLLRVL